MERREFLKLASAAVAAAQAPAAVAQNTAAKPNVIILIADQVRNGLTKAQGYPLDTSPTLDAMAARGVRFDRAYCTTPLCVPSRISMITGRWPEAHHVRMNLQKPEDAFFEKDVFQVAKESGYRTALCGKNHTYMNVKHTDFWREYGHGGGYKAPDAPKEIHEFEKWMNELSFNIAMEPAPFGVEVQLPYRIVSDALEFVKSSQGQPFLMEVSFPEPHDPEQVPAPYWNMFPPESVPDRCADGEAWKKLGPRARWLHQLQEDNFPSEKNWRRYKSNYLGALRMIDDQVKRLLDGLRAAGVLENTVIVSTADHGDYLMDYGLARKGAGLPEALINIPMVWTGFGVKPSNAGKSAHVSNADIMPTLCEAIGAAIPHGVQGRSLWPVLQGERYPQEEFRSAYSGVGVGGLYYEESDNVPTTISHDAKRPGSWDELNGFTMSGNQKMVRMGDWKLVYDMMGYGQLYNLKQDPCELVNLFGQEKFAAEQAKLMAELAMWVIRTQDALPTGPQNKKYTTKWPREHNWYSPYRHGTAPTPYIP